MPMGVNLIYAYSERRVSVGMLGADITKTESAITILESFGPLGGYDADATICRCMQPFLRYLESNGIMIRSTAADAPFGAFREGFGGRSLPWGSIYRRVAAHVQASETSSYRLGKHHLNRYLKELAGLARLLVDGGYCDP